MLCIAQAGALLLASCDPQSDGELIRYRRGGGFAGISTELVVYHDGTARYTPERNADSVRYSVSDPLAEDLTDALNDVDWDAIEGRYPPVCCDMFNLELSYDDHYVSWIGGGQREVDRELAAVTTALNKISALAPDESQRD